MTTITIVGNMASDIELRFTSSGKAVASFTVAESERVKDNGEWTDGPTTWWKCSIWDQAAENLTESLAKGQRVIVVGRVAQREFETKAGEKRSVFEVTATEIGPSLKWAVAKPEKTTLKGSGFASKRSKPVPAIDDPWGTETTVSDEAPF